MHRGGVLATILQLHGKIVILLDELVDLGFDQIILVLKHPDMGLECLRLLQQVEVVVITPVVDHSLLLDLTLKLLNNCPLFIDLVVLSVILVRDLSCLLLHDQALLLEALHLAILVLELVLDGLFFPLELFDLLIELVEFDLLALNLLVVVGQFFLAFPFFGACIVELTLGVKEVVFRLA